MDILMPPGGNGPGVLVAHPWWGLNQTIRDYGAALARDGFVVGMPDLFDGAVTDTIEGAQQQAQANWPTATERLTRALDELASQTGGPVGAVGFSYGAFHLMRLLESDVPMRALAIYYATFSPLPARHAPVLAHLAEKDSEESMADMVALRDALAAAGPPNAAFIYPGMKHWFAEADRPEYAPDIAALAFQRTVAFLRETVPA
jgi:carboxymethylenebutenolidase